MIRVLHSELEYRLGGIESFLMNLTKTIDLKEIHFDFLMRGENQIIEKELLKYGCKIYKVPEGIIDYVKYVNQVLNEGSYDILHIHKNSALNLLLPIIVKTKRNIKIIVHSHNTQPSYPRKLKVFLHYLNRPLLNILSDKKFACSELAAEWLFGKNYLKEGNVFIIRNGIISQQYIFDGNKRNIIRDNLGIKKNEFALVHVGAFREQKNHKFLLQIIDKLKDDGFKLFLIGDGPLEKEIRDKTNEMGLNKSVMFLGIRNDVPQLLCAMDIFVMPSKWEGLPVSCIEAQASGLPLILSDTISRMCKITSNVKFVQNDSLETWCKQILLTTEEFERCDTLKEIRSAGYDMNTTADMVLRYYKELV